MAKKLPRILCVDDEPNILEALERGLFEYFEVTTALSGFEGLALLREDDYQVVVSDMRMPEMDGAEFLKRVRKEHPFITRILLTGQAELESAMKAINEGHVFRFLLKPCDSEVLAEHIKEGIKLYRLKHYEKDLLENTLKGAVKVLADILHVAKPEAFRSSYFTRRIVMHIAREHKLQGRWEFDIAAMLCQLGAVTLPDETLKRAFKAAELEPDDEIMLQSIPSQGSRLLERIPRLDRIAQMIESQTATDSELEVLEGRVKTGARLLRIATWIEQTVLHKNISTAEAIKAADRHFKNIDDLHLLGALRNYVPVQETKTLQEIKVSEVKVGMVLAEDVYATNGHIVLSQGQTLKGFLIDRLYNFDRGTGIKEPIKVYS